MPLQTRSTMGLTKQIAINDAGDQDILIDIEESLDLDLAYEEYPYELIAQAEKRAENQ